MGAFFLSLGIGIGAFVVRILFDDEIAREVQFALSVVGILFIALAFAM